MDAANFPVAIKALPNNEAGYFNLGVDTGVIQLPILAPPASSSEANAYIRNVAQLVNEALAYLKEQAFTRVLIDVSRNPGGDIVAGLAVFQQIFPTSTPYYGQDMRYSPLLANLTQEFTAANTNQSIALSFKCSVQQERQLLPLCRCIFRSGIQEWWVLHEPTQKKRSGVLGIMAWPWRSFHFSTRQRFAPEQIGLLSDSLCFDIVPLS